MAGNQLQLLQQDGAKTPAPAGARQVLQDPVQQDFSQLDGPPQEQVVCFPLLTLTTPFL